MTQQITGLILLLIIIIFVVAILGKEYNETFWQSIKRTCIVLAFAMLVFAAIIGCFYLITNGKRP